MIALHAPLDCDDRENPEILDPLAQAGANITRLAAADYKWDTPLGPAVIQRKSIVDAMQSIKDGTINAEMWAALHESAAYVFLLLELERGTIQVTSRGNLQTGTWPSGFALTSLLNYLATVQRHGAILHISPDVTLTPAVIASLMDYTLKPYHSNFYRRGVAEGPPQFSTLLTVPGISAYRGALLLERYQTLLEAAEAPEDELLAIDGIGPRTARKFHAFWREPWR